MYEYYIEINGVRSKPVGTESEMLQAMNVIMHSMVIAGFDCTSENQYYEHSEYRVLTIAPAIA
jgi:hypothetical protein